MKHPTLSWLFKASCFIQKNTFGGPEGPQTLHSVSAHLALSRDPRKLSATHLNKLDSQHLVPLTSVLFTSSSFPISHPWRLPRLRTLRLGLTLQVQALLLGSFPYCASASSGHCLSQCICQASCSLKWAFILHKYRNVQCPTACKESSLGYLFILLDLLAVELHHRSFIVMEIRLERVNDINWKAYLT